MTAHILLIEDDERIRTLLPRYFARESMQMVAAATGESGLTAVRDTSPSLVLLDVNLPDIDGWSVLRRIRTVLAPDLPVIMLTSRSDVPDRLMGLDLGADDYIVKPFEPLEVVARVKAVLRRARPVAASASIVTHGALRIDLDSRQVWVDEQPVNLSAREFDMLALLVRHPDRVITRDRLIEVGWGDDPPMDEHALDVAMNRLRTKLGAGVGYTCLHTVRGVGYRFTCNDA